MSRNQINILNRLISASSSHAVGTMGRDVLVFEATGNLEDALTQCGFAQNIKRDRMNQTYGHTLWWNDAASLLVSNVPRSLRWSISTPESPLTSAEYSEMEVL